MAEHSCEMVAVVGRTLFPCQSHEVHAHHFAAHWPCCPSPFCTLPPGHASLHASPAGLVKVCSRQELRERGLL